MLSRTFLVFGLPLAAAFIPLRLIARDTTGALFGFERTAALAKLNANQIAHAAEEFGTEDDITVLTLVRTEC